LTKIRTFIAIDIPESIRRRLDEQTSLLRAQVPRNCVRWVRSSGIHLTLKFLGDIFPEQADEVGRSLDQVVSTFSPFTVTISKLGTFPTPNRPRVIWVGVHELSGSLGSLQSALELACERLGFARERRDFHPHLTLGRVKRKIASSSLRQLAEALRDLEVGDLGQISVEAVCLFRSELKPSGAEYTRLAQAFLKGGR
jgi:2'-5' RNA ligase